MELYLMRHADAGRPEPQRYPDDRLRPLSEQGVQEQRRMMSALGALLQPLDHLLSSPLRRARQTAGIVAEALHCTARIEETEILGGDCTVGGVIDLLHHYPPDARILCVGHEPDMSNLAAVFLDGEGRCSIAFQPGSLIGLHFPGHPVPGHGTLRCFVRAAELLHMLAV